MNEFKIKKIHPDAVFPERKSEQAIGYDLYLPSKTTIMSRSREIIPLGFALELPENIEAKIEPRSGFSADGIGGYLLTPPTAKRVDPTDYNNWKPESHITHFDADVLVGKIDPDYRGEVCVIISNHDSRPFCIPKGTRIAQMTFYRTESATFTQVDALSDTPRGEGGFGSTGANG